MSGIRSVSTHSVWVVWGGLGGDLFTVCETKKDAMRLAKFKSHLPKVEIFKVPVVAVERLRREAE